MLGKVRLDYWGRLLCSSLYYFGEYHSRLGLKKESLFSKKIFKWVGLDFVSDSCEFGQIWCEIGHQPFLTVSYYYLYKK